MKRLICMLAAVLSLLAVFSCAAADDRLRGYENGKYVYVTLGQYPQHVDTGSGKVDGGSPREKSWTWSRHPVKAGEPVEIITEPILWRVLRADEEKADLCSEYVLLASGLHADIRGYRTVGKDFGQTDLSRYLNTVFAADAFTGAELDMLLPQGTFGKVFLLDAPDVKDKSLGMGNGEGMKAWGTEYAIRVTGLFVYQNGNGSHSPYWVMSQSTSDARHGRCTKAGGTLGHIVCDRENEGVRPAVCLDLNACAIVGGSGTMTDPYQLAASKEE